MRCQLWLGLVCEGSPHYLTLHLYGALWIVCVRGWHVCTWVRVYVGTCGCYSRQNNYLGVSCLECGLGSGFVRFVRCLIGLRLGLFIHMCSSNWLVRTNTGRGVYWSEAARARGLKRFLYIHAYACSWFGVTSEPRTLDSRTQLIHRISLNITEHRPTYLQR